MDHFGIVNVKTVWDTIVEVTPFEKIRTDRAVCTQSGKLDYGIEVGYGSRTVRVRLFINRELLRFWDLQTDWGMPRFLLWLDEFKQDLALRGINAR